MYKEDLSDLQTVVQLVQQLLSSDRKVNNLVIVQSMNFDVSVGVQSKLESQRSSF